MGAEVSGASNSRFVGNPSTTGAAPQKQNRSRDNLANPIQDPAGDHAYVPRNMPAIGDLFDLFDFDGKDRR